MKLHNQERLEKTEDAIREGQYLAHKTQTKTKNTTQDRQTTLNMSKADP